jgi:hypothetical protein
MSHHEFLRPTNEYNPLNIDLSPWSPITIWKARIVRRVSSLFLVSNSSKLGLKITTSLALDDLDEPDEPDDFPTVSPKES